MVAMLWFVGCLNYLDRIMLTTMRVSIVEAIPMSDAQFGLLTAIFLWVYGALSPMAGFLADKFSRTRIIIVSLFVWSIVTWLTAHARTYNELLFSRALMGISEACYIPAALALIADYHRGRTRSLANGIQIMGMFVGQGLGGLGGLIAEHYRWTTAFTVFGFVGIAYSVVLVLWLRDSSARTSGSRVATASPRFLPAVRSLFERRTFLLALVFWGLLGLANWAVAGWMPTYFNTKFKLSQGAAGLSATGYLQLMAFVGVLFGGWWADRLRRSHENAPVFVPLVGMLIAAPAVLLVANTESLFLAIVGLMIFGGVRCFADANMMPILCLISDERYRATGYGILNCFSCFIGGLAIYAGGLLRDANVGLDNIFRFAAGCVAVCAVLLWGIIVARRRAFVALDASGVINE
jgi:MFS family permease